MAGGGACPSEVRCATIGRSGARVHGAVGGWLAATVLDVAPSDDAFETRERVMAAMQGHVIGKAVYVGRFRRPN